MQDVLPSGKGGEMTILALTARGVACPKTFTSPKAAREWAEESGARYGCARIVCVLPSGGKRTLWPRKETPS